MAATWLITQPGSTVHDLKSKILDIARTSKELVPMRINVLSFGFKYGKQWESIIAIAPSHKIAKVTQPS